MSEKIRCDYDGTELDEAMECPSCLSLLVQYGKERAAGIYGTAVNEMLRRTRCLTL